LRGWPSARGVFEAGTCEETIAGASAQRAVIRKTRVKDGRAQATGGDAAALWFPDRYGLLHLLEGGFAEEAIAAEAF